MTSLRDSGLLNDSQLDRYGREVLASIQKALVLPVAQLPRYPRQRQKTISSAVSDRIQRLRRWRDAQARRLKIDPSLICSKAAMSALAERKPEKMEDLADLNELKQWQRNAFGKDMIATLKKAR